MIESARTRLDSILPLFILLVVPTFAFGATWVVDQGGGGDFLDVSSGVAAAAPGDTVLVEPAIYSERVVLDRAIVLRSTGGSVATRILSVVFNEPVLDVVADGAVCEGFHLVGGRDGLEVASTVTDFTAVDLDCENNEGFQARLPAHLVASVVPGLVLTTHPFDGPNAVAVTSGGIAASSTWPALPTGFCYLMDWAVVTVRGPAGPVLTIPSGTIVKGVYSRFEIGSATEPGGLVADGVIFTSLHDDEGSDTDGTDQDPYAGNWQRLDFNAMARADSCLVRGSEFRYGGNGVGVIHVDGSSPTITGCTFIENNGCVNAAIGTPVLTTISGNTFQQGSNLPIHACLDQVDALVFGNTLVPRGDGALNGIGIKSSTVSMSWTLPALPHGFHYCPDWATITVRGPSGPVLTIPSGSVVKGVYSRFEIGSATEPGGLVADGVLFTSFHDDEAGDTNGSVLAPGAGNWQRLDFNAMARADSCLVRGSEFRYGGNGVGVIHVDGSTPTITGCTFRDNNGCVNAAAGTPPLTGVAGNVFQQGSNLPIHASLDQIVPLVFGNTIVPRGDDVLNGIGIKNSTVSTSWTLPVLPHGFHYCLDWATITVRGPSGPVLTIPSGSVVKSTFGRFEIGSASEPGGLVADGVLFTSFHDDEAGDTNGSVLAPGAGNWQRLDFNAMARADSCLVRGSTFRYGGNGVGVVHVDGSTPTISGCTFTDNNGCVNAAAGTPVLTTIAGNTFQQGSNLPIHASLEQIDPLVFGNTLVPRGDDVLNGIGIKNSTVSTSWTLPTLPHGFHYYFDWATIAVRGPSGPVLTIPSGSIIKGVYSRFETGTANEPGGLMAEDVVFTSGHDDVGGDTNGSTLAPAPGNWQRLDFNAAARADSCLLRECEFRYGGNGGSVIEVDGSSPRFDLCTMTRNSGAGFYSRGATANPTLWFCSLTDNTQYGLRKNGGQVHVVRCCFEGNGEYGALVEEGVLPGSTLLMTNCWWGDAAGPAGEGPGAGDAVSAGVRFDPWAVTPACDSLTEVPPELVHALALHPASPNPFNPATTIVFELPRAEEVSLDVVDLQGRRIAVLAAGVRDAGRHEIAWRGRDDRGRAVGAGVYLVRLKTPDAVKTGKLVLVK